MILKNISYLFYILFAFIFCANSNASDDIFEANKKQLTMAEEYFNNMSTMRANFIQIAPDDSIAKGEIYMDRPSQIRIKYTSGLNIDLSVNKKIITYFDRGLDQISHVKTKKTIAEILTRKTFRFTDSDIDLKDFRSTDGGFAVSMFKKDNSDEGEFILFFKNKGTKVELTRIDIKAPNSENVTKLNLMNIKYGVSLPDDIFKIGKSRISIDN